MTLHKLFFRGSLLAGFLAPLATSAHAIDQQYTPTFPILFYILGGAGAFIVLCGIFFCFWKYPKLRASKTFKKRLRDSSLPLIKLVAVVLVAAGSIYLAYHQRNSAAVKTVVVVVTDSGFEPQSVLLNEGDTVVWQNKSTHLFWPASDPHPTHDFYPEFDPEKAIQPGSSWSFVFTKVGTWGYHDHLFSTTRGTITVTEKTLALSNTVALEQPPEMAQLLAEKDPSKQRKIVHAMALKYGPKQALLYMEHSGLPFTGETHLLIHEIGTVAYEKYGDRALLYCNESFLAACYHGVVLNALADNGMSGVKSLMEQCKSADATVISQCSHAAGHGFLALKDYKVLDALPMCDELNTREPAAPSFNCYDGVFMENIFGVHEGAPSPNRMVKESDPNYPCDAVPDKYKNGCWADQATLMYELFKGDLKKVAEGCDKVQNKTYQATCYDNFARQIHPLTQGKADKAIELCQNATGVWKDTCLITLVNAAFSVGDTKVMPYALCTAMKNSPRHDACYATLFQQISVHGHNAQELALMCGYITEPLKMTECEKRFGVQAQSLSANMLGSVGATNEFATAQNTSNDPASAEGIKSIQDLAKTKGVVAAYDWIKKQYGSSPTQAHDLAHIVGRLAYEQQGIKGFDVCDNQFGFGCYHGLLEILIKDKGDEAIDIARKGCTGLSLQGQVASCLHGIGHGIMAEKGNLKEAVRQCSNFPSGEQIYCFDGVYMEYYIGTMKRPGGNLSFDYQKPWDLCLSMTSASQGQCVRNATFHLLYSDSKNLSKAAGACDVLSQALRPNCLQSFGLYAAQISEGDPQPVMHVCTNFSKSADKAFCISAAAQEFIFEGKGVASSQNLCNALEGTLKQTCMDGISQITQQYGI